MRSVDMKEFRKAMIDADYNTFGELEEKSGIDKSTISCVINGGRFPSYESISKLSDSLHLTYADIGRIFFYNGLTEK